MLFQRAEIRDCLRSFRHFLRYWQFKAREPADDPVLTFATLWPGQATLAAVMEQARWIVDLKAGKQGHSEIECAWDGFASWSGPPNNRVHMYSQKEDEAQEFLQIVRFGLLKLPPYFGVTLLPEESGGDATGSLKYARGADDVRTIVAYPAKPGAGINQSAWHVHMDEVSQMTFGEGVYDGASTTVVPGGSLHAISRGRTPDDQMARLWAMAVPDGMTYTEAHTVALAAVAAGDDRRLVPVFVDYRGRPGRDEAWYARESQTRSPAAMRHYAPADPEEALSGDADQAFVDEAQWDQLEVVPVIGPGDRAPVVISLDAGVKSDHFALVLVGRCPNHPGEPSVRLAREWVPNPLVSFEEVKAYIRQLYVDYNIVCTVYDPSQLYDMAQGLGRLGWWDEFNQTNKRLVADAALRQRIVDRRLARIEHDALRSAIVGAGVKLDKDDKKLRIVKRTTKKIDLAVAVSQGVHAVMELNL